MVAYLRNHPLINQEMTFLVRQLDATEHGLPIEIYVFSRDKEWSSYEGIQADIFDHILAIASAFDLRVYQSPSGADVRGALEVATRVAADRRSKPDPSQEKTAVLRSR